MDAWALTLSSGPDNSLIFRELPFISVPVRAASRAPTGCAIFVLPNRLNVANAAAVLSAMAFVKESYPRCLAAYRGKLRPGMLVKVLPNGYVYELGPEETIDDRRFLWLKIRVAPKKRRRHSFVDQPARRTFPAGEFLRLVPTNPALTTRFGAENAPLGAAPSAPLDALLGINTYGNPALFPNHVLLLGAAGEIERFFERVSLTDGSLRAIVGGGMANGRILEDGHFDRSDQVDADPLIGTSFRPEYVAAACERSEAGTVKVFADGASALAAAPQAFDRIVERQRLVILADLGEVDRIWDLAGRGAVVWQPEAAAVIAGTSASVGPVSPSLFGPLIQASSNAAHLTIVLRSLPPTPVDDLARILHECTPPGSDADPDAAVLREILSGAWKCLRRLASWLNVPTGQNAASWQDQVHALRRSLLGQRPYLEKSVATALATVIEELSALSRSDVAPAARRQALLAALQERHVNNGVSGVLARTATHAGAIQTFLTTAQIRAAVGTLTVLKGAGTFDHVVVASWPGSPRMRELWATSIAPRIDLLLCPFEIVWYEHARPQWERDRASWRVPPMWLPADAQPSSVGTGFNFPTLDGVPEWARRGAADEQIRDERKAGPSSTDIPELDRRSARYVDFVGDCYAFLTLSHRVPILTDLFSRTSGQERHLKLGTVSELRPGDIILFRASGRGTVIEDIAKDELGAAEYIRLREVANLWRVGLQRLGSTVADIHSRLEHAGTDRTAQAVRQWLQDDDLIGPGRREDLARICALLIPALPGARIDEIWEAIRTIRIAHQGAGRILTHTLRKDIEESIPSLGGEETVFTIRNIQVTIVEVSDIAPFPEDRSYLDVNHLLRAE